MAARNVRTVLSGIRHASSSIRDEHAVAAVRRAPASNIVTLATVKGLGVALAGSLLGTQRLPRRGAKAESDLAIICGPAIRSRWVSSCHGHREESKSEGREKHGGGSRYV